MQVTDSRLGFHQTLRAYSAHYCNAQISLRLVTDDDESWLVGISAIASPIPTGCVAARDWSDNEGVPEIRLSARVIEGDPVSRVPICRLTAAALQAAGAAAVQS